jgi:hypothetical protein
VADARSLKPCARARLERSSVGHGPIPDLKECSLCSD